MIKDKHIAVAYNDKGELFVVSKVKVVTEAEYQTLLSEQSKYYADKEAKEQEEKDKLDERLCALEKHYRDLTSVLCHILGYEELDESVIRKYLEVEYNEEE